MTETATPDQMIAVPSGMDVRLLEIISDTAGTAGLTVRYRFVAPALKQASLIDEGQGLLADIEHLCTNFALPQLRAATPLPDQVVISVSEQETVFGQATPDVYQVFEGFRLENDACIWEPF